MPTEVLQRPVAALNGVVVSPRPLVDDIQLHAVPEGLSVAGMVAFLEDAGGLDRAVRPWLRVVVGDQVVERAAWHVVVPTAGEPLAIEVAPMASSNPTRTLLQIAVIALAVFTGGTGIIATGLVLGGMALVNAVAPIKQPDVARREERYSLSGASNAAAPHEALPIVLGRRRIYPRRCANWYTVTVANTVYLRLMFQPSVSWVDHESPRIGEADVSSYDGVTLRWRTRPDEDIEPIWFNQVPAEDGYGVPITQDAGWVTRPFPIEADTLSFDAAFMAGLYETKESSGNPKNRTVTYEFRYGPRDGDPAAATPCPFTVGGLKSWTRDKLEAYREGFSWAVPRGEYDLHARRVTPDPGNTAKISDELTLVCLRAFRNEPAVRDLTGKPWIEMEIKASEQLNGVLDNFSFVATSIVPQATAEGPGALVATRNPADLYLAASYPPFSEVELDEDERDFAAIAAWRATCAANGWNCDLAESGEVGVGDLLQRVAAMGRARPTLGAIGALSVVVDWAKPLPRQMFTPRNVSGFVGEIVYPEPVHALRLRFQNAAKDYDDDIAVVFAPDYDIDTATLYGSVEVRDKTDLEEVEREGMRLLAEPVLRPETFTFEQDWENLTIAEGQRAYLAHHVALVGQISGRVDGLVVDPGAPARKGLRLDELVVMEAGRSYDLTWRPSTDAALQTFALETVAGQDDVVWFVAPAPVAAIQEGDLVTIHEHVLELLDVVVNRISPSEGLSAELSCVPYAPELQALIEGEIPSYRTGASRPPTLSSASIVRRTVRAIDQVLDQIGGAVDEAGKGIEAIGDGTGPVAGRPGYELNAAVAAAEAIGQAAALEAGEATAALFTPGTGVVSRVDGLKTQADGLAASLSSETALRIAGDAASAGRLDQAEAKFRSLPNLIRNGDGSASQASDLLKDWNEIGASGFAYAGTSSAVGAHWYLAANTSGAVRYFVTDWYGVDPSMPVSASASGETFGAAGANRSQIYLDWGLGGASVGGSAHVFLDATNLDWLSKRAQVIATAPASGANQMRFVVSQPPGSPGLYITRVMVNYGGAPLPFNDLLTERETRARVTQTELAQAASDSSLAALTNRVGVSMQQGSSQVRNAYFGAYTNASGLADGWNDWAGGSTAVRVDGAGANFAPRFTVPVGTDRGFVQSFTLAPGRYTMRYEGYCRAGNWGGAGLFIHRQGDGAIIAFIDCDNDPDGAGVTGVGAVGYRGYSKTFDLAATTAVSLFAMAGWTGFGPVIAKTLDIWACDVYPVDAAVRQAQADATTALTGNSTLAASFASAQTATNARFTSPTGEVQVAKSQAISESLANTNLAVSNLRQSVSTSAGDLVATAGAAFTAASDAEAKLAVGRIDLIAAGGSGVPAKMAIVSDSAGGSAIQLSAGQIGFGDNTTFDDATDTTRTVTNGVATVIAWGASFGGDLGGATLREWMGPASVALSAMTRANAYSYRADTLPYAGGSAVSGVDGALMKIGSGTAGGVSSSSFVDILVLPFSSIPAAGYWSVGADFYAGQTSSPTQSTASGVARLVERKAGFSDVALTGDVPWSVAWHAGDLAYESSPAQPVNAGIASTYTGAVSIVLQARKTGGAAVGGAALNYQARATWTKAG